MVKLIKDQWETSIAKMYQGDNMKVFYLTLRNLSKYGNAKSGSFVQSIMIGHEIVEDSKIIAEAVAKEVLRLITKN